MKFKTKYAPIFMEALEKNKTFQIPVTLEGAYRKKDKSVSVRFTSNFEMTTPDFAEVDKMLGNQGWLMFKENDSFLEQDVPREQAPVDVGQKKPSVRLRNVLYRVWEQKTNQSEPFDTHWYPKQMERLIERYKAELE